MSGRKVVRRRFWADNGPFRQLLSPFCCYLLNRILPGTPYVFSLTRLYVIPVNHGFCRFGLLSVSVNCSVDSCIESFY